MPYPNVPFWSALEDGREIEIDNTPCLLHVVECGTLRVPYGQLVACDPFVELQPEGNLFVPIPPGEYPVFVTVADVSGLGYYGPRLVEAYATVVLGEGEEAMRRIITPLSEGVADPESVDDVYQGFSVDSGTACFMDGGALPDAMPPASTWDDVFDDGSPGSWINRVYDSADLREGLANIVLPNAKDGENIIIVSAAWGDGAYPVIGGYDAAGKLLRVHIDFRVVY